MADHPERCRRAQYRAMHRGTKEMDWLLGRYAAASVLDMREAELETFEMLLAVADPQLYRWIALGEPADRRELAPLIETIRRFHGLEPAS